MNNFPFGFQPIAPTTWAYLSSLLMLALFFKFNRFWSFRNFDLFLIILLTPGLLMVHFGQESASIDREKSLTHQVIEDTSLPSDDSTRASTSPKNLPEIVDADTKNKDAELKPGTETTPAPTAGSKHPLTRNQLLEHSGYIWMFSVGLLWLIRLFFDPMLIRKPMLEPNLSIGGLVFLACSLMIFLFVNVSTSQPRDLSGPEGAAKIVQRQVDEQFHQHGPGYEFLHLLPAIPTFVDPTGMSGVDPNDEQGMQPSVNQYLLVARIMAIISQVIIVGSLIFIGKEHFGSFQMGIGMATIFLMLPYTAQYAGDSAHLLPGALLILAIAAFRRPFVAGIFIGLAAGVCYYPFFLLPLWLSFYWHRGRKRFMLGTFLSIALVVSSLAFTSPDMAGFLRQLQNVFGFMLPRTDSTLGGIWALNWEKSFRLPLLAGFVVLCISYAFWPLEKNLGSLISCTAAAMIAVQFWHGNDGGVLVAWYLPLILLVIFRPNLDDQIATRVLNDPAS